MQTLDWLTGLRCVPSSSTLQDFGKTWCLFLLCLGKIQGESHLDLGFPLRGGLIAVPVSLFIIDFIQIVDFFQCVGHVDIELVQSSWLLKCWDYKHDIPELV